MLINLAPPFATITGSNTILIFLILFKENNTASMTSFECNIPIFTALGFISFAVNKICFLISVGGILIMEDTPVVFWAVIAVTAVMA